MEFLIIGTYIQVLTFLLSVLCWAKYKHTHLRSLPLYFGVFAFIELFCFHFYKQDNVWLYNLLIFFEVIFFCYLFYPYVGRSFQKIVIALAVVFNVVSGLIYSFGYCDFWNEHCAYSYVLGIFIILIVIFKVLVKILIVNSYTKLGSSLLLWICFGFLIFFATSLPLFSISNWSNLVGEYNRGISLLLFFSVIISHLIFIFGFLWSKKKYTY